MRSFLILISCVVARTVQKLRGWYPEETIAAVRKLMKKRAEGWFGVSFEDDDTGGDGEDAGGGGGGGGDGEGDTPKKKERSKPAAKSKPKSKTAGKKPNKSNAKSTDESGGEDEEAGAAAAADDDGGGGGGGDKPKKKKAAPKSKSKSKPAKKSAAAADNDTDSLAAAAASAAGGGAPSPALEPQSGIELHAAAMKHAGGRILPPSATGASPAFGSLLSSPASGPLAAQQNALSIAELALYVIGFAGNCVSRCSSCLCVCVFVCLCVSVLWVKVPRAVDQTIRRSICIQTIRRDFCPPLPLQPHRLVVVVVAAVAVDRFRPSDLY